MSDGNKGHNDLQDYLDLLDAYSRRKQNGLDALREQEEKKIEEQNLFSEEKTESRLDEQILYEQVAEKHRKIEERRRLNTSDLDSSDFFSFSDEETEELSEEEPKKSSVQINIDPSVLDEEPEALKPTVPPMKNSEKKQKGIKKFTNWYKNLPKGKKIAFTVISVILVIAIILVGVVGIFVASKVSLIKDADDIAKEDVIYEDPVHEEIEIDFGSASFKQALMDWATKGNDKHMYSKNVINVLLIGADSRDGTNSGNTDVMMLLSLNKKTKQLKICSFLRDSYLYVEGSSRAYCTKLNAAYSMGGAKCLVQTIENNYKIEIDNYVMVNFETFEKIIDAMGGVTVDVKQYEANEIVRYTKGAVSPPVGDGVTLDGEEALYFCRIRKCDADGDISRTRRQRMVIENIIDKVLSASISDINKYINILLPHVMTGYKESEIFSLGVKAVTGGWAMYEREQIQVPSEENRVSGDADMWIWVVDYQKAAHDLQMSLYGQSNITIHENRISIIDVYNGATYSGEADNLEENSLADEPEVPDETYTPSTTAATTTAPQYEETTTAPAVTESETETTTAAQTDPPAPSEEITEEEADDFIMAGDDV